MAIDEGKVLDLVTAAGAMSEKVAAAEAVREKQSAAIEELIPDVVVALVAGDRIAEGDREKMARVLRDPVNTLRFIEKLAGHRNGAEALAMGQPVQGSIKAASDAYNSLESPLVGVPTAQIKESDRRFLTALGLQG